MPRTVAPPPPRARSGLSRRGLLVLGAVAAGGGALAGCDTLPAPRSARPEAPGADETLVDQAVVALQAQVTLIRRTTRRHTGLRTRLAPVLALHAAHLDALRPDGDASSPSPSSPSPSPRPTAVPVPRRAAVALSSLADAERALHARLKGLALEAHSGDLARLLAAVAAGTGQRLAVWPA